jgi:hypothetical protein
MASEPSPNMGGRTPLEVLAQGVPEELQELDDAAYCSRPRHAHLMDDGLVSDAPSRTSRI